MAAIQEKRMTIREAAAWYAVPYSTLQQSLKARKVEVVGRPKVLSDSEEKELCTYLLQCAEWKLPFQQQEVTGLVQDYLNTQGRTTRFPNNKPGRDWWLHFKARHKELTEKFAGNLK
jgi:hypothetical protein